MNAYRGRGVHRMTLSDKYIGMDVPDEQAYPALLKILLAKSQRLESGCLIFTGWCNDEGYGQRSFRGRSHPTHRLMYICVHGPIPDGLIVRHTCDNPPCMEPDHLITGTEKDNTGDSIERDRHYNDKQTHCWRGHRLEGDNVYINKTNLTRHCKTCHRAKHRMMAGWNEYDALTVPKLMPGDRAENIVRVAPYKGREKESSHCTRGHLLAGDNLYISPRGYHECQICRADARKRFVARQAAKRALTSTVSKP